jgi:hypothetical protein
MQIEKRPKSASTHEAGNNRIDVNPERFVASECLGDVVWNSTRHVRVNAEHFRRRLHAQFVDDLRTHIAACRHQGTTPVSTSRLTPTFRTVSSVKSGRFVRSGLITRSMTEGNPIENVLSIDNRRTKSSGLTDDLHRRWERPVGGERSRWDGISRWIRTLEVAQRRSSTRIGKWRTRLPVA